MYYRRLPKFEYLAPKSVAKATDLLKEFKGNAIVTAGGTIVLHRMKERIVVRKVLIGLKAISDLDHIIFDESSGLRIGCMATLQSIADSPAVKELFKLLSLVCGKLGSPQIRNMGTIGGNVCSRFPGAEPVPALIALGAEARIVSPEGEKTVPLEDLNKVLKQSDLLTEIHVPTPVPDTQWGYQKYAIREGIDYATASAAVAATRKNGECENIRIGLGGISSKRAEEAEKVVKGQPITESVIEEAAQMASKNARTVSDIHFSADYKKEVIRVMAKRAIQQALKI